MPSRSPDLARFLAAARAAVGDDGVIVDDEARRRYAAGTDGSTVLPAAIVLPRATDAVAVVVRAARTHGVTLHPISRGKNYGYGDAQGTAAGQVIVDLQRMDRVVAVDDVLGTCTLEAGVSQIQLYDALVARGSRLQLDVTGAGQHASVVGNVLERGFGHTEYGDRYHRALRLTVVLPTGEVVQTGFGPWEGAEARDAYRTGVGPFFEGLFSQSNFGIVTEMTLQLMPRPKSTTLFGCTSPDEGALGAIVDVVRELRLHGVVDSAVHIANRARAAGNRKAGLVGAWNLSGGISGSPNLVAARRREVKRAFARLGFQHRLLFIDDRRMRLLEWAARFLPLSFMTVLRDAHDLHRGFPTEGPMHKLFDTGAVGSHQTPDEFPAGLVWLNGVVPARGDSATRAVTLLQRLFADAGRDFRVTLTAISPRALVLITNVNFPRDAASATAARAFADDVMRELARAGFLPYRMGLNEPFFGVAGPHDPRPLLARLRATLDPDGVLSPGKYALQGPAHGEDNAGGTQTETGGSIR
jgi:4-cresol dehydrogenase (hydroxylating)